jgi:hypothetical protein
MLLLDPKWKRITFIYVTVIYKTNYYRNQRIFPKKSYLTPGLNGGCLICCRLDIFKSNKCELISYGFGICISMYIERVY